MAEVTISKRHLKERPDYFIRKLLTVDGAAFIPSPQQMKVLKSLNKRKVIVAGRRFGKTMLAAAYALYFATQRPRTRIGIFTPSWEQCEVFMDWFYRLIDESVGGVLRETIVEQRKMSCIFDNGSKLICRTASITSKSVRGHGFDLLILDEAAFIPDEVMAAIRPTRLDRKGEEWQLSNPLGHNHFYNSFMTGKEKGIFDVFQIKTSENPKIDIEDLNKERLLLSPAEFKQEYEGFFVDDQYTIFPQKLIDRARELAMKREIDFSDIPSTEENITYYMGVDLGRKQDSSVITIIKKNNDDSIADVVFIKERINDHTDTFWTRVLDDIEYYVRKFHVVQVSIDQTGIGDKPTLDLRHTFNKKNLPCLVDGVWFTSGIKNARDGIINTMLMYFERGQIALPHHPKLIKQLKNLRRQIPKRPTQEVSAIYSLTGLDFAASLALAIKALPFSEATFYAKANDPLPEEEKSGGMVVVNPMKPAKPLNSNSPLQIFTNQKDGDERTQTTSREDK